MKESIIRRNYNTADLILLSWLYYKLDMGYHSAIILALFKPKMDILSGYIKALYLEPGIQKILVKKEMKSLKKQLSWLRSIDYNTSRYMVYSSIPRNAIYEVSDRITAPEKSCLLLNDLKAIKLVRLPVDSIKENSNFSYYTFKVINRKLCVLVDVLMFQNIGQVIYSHN